MILILPVTLSIRLDEAGRLRLRLHTLGIALYRSEKKQRRVRLSHYSKRAMARRERVEARRQRKKAKRASEHPTPTPPPDKAPLTDKISFITDLSTTLLHHTLSRARVRIDRMAITVGSTDAAKTAILCGVLSPALAFLLETLEQFSHLHIAKDAPVGVAPDFTSEHTRADIRLHFRLHVAHLVCIALHTAMHVMSRKAKSKKR